MEICRDATSSIYFELTIEISSKYIFTVFLCSEVEKYARSCEVYLKKLFNKLWLLATNNTKTFCNRIYFLYYEHVQVKRESYNIFKISTLTCQLLYLLLLRCVVRIYWSPNCFNSYNTGVSKFSKALFSSSTVSNSLHWRIFCSYDLLILLDPLSPSSNFP